MFCLFACVFCVLISWLVFVGWFGVLCVCWLVFCVLVGCFVIVGLV